MKMDPCEYHEKMEQLLAEQAAFGKKKTYLPDERAVEDESLRIK